MDPTPHDATDDRDDLVGFLAVLILYALALPFMVPFFLLAVVVFAVVDVIVYQRVPWTLVEVKGREAWDRLPGRRRSSRSSSQASGTAGSSWPRYRFWLGISMLVSAAGMAMIQATASSTAGSALAGAAQGAVLGAVVVWPVWVLCAQLPPLGRYLARTWQSLRRDDKLVVVTVIFAVVMWLLSLLRQHNNNRPY